MYSRASSKPKRRHAFGNPRFQEVDLLFIKMQTQLLVDLLAQTLELFDREVWHGVPLSS